LESLLSNNGVKVVFNGHAHTYQRIAPSGAGDVVNYVTGGGGGILEPVSGGSACSAFQSSGSIYAIGWSPTSSSGTACGAPTPASAAQVFNFLKVTVSGNTATVSPTNAAGQVFDQQSYTYAGSSFPATIIDSPPSALTSSTSASISFHSSPAGATFTCSLDGAAPTACTSPATYTGLAQGSHTFSVVGTNSSGSNPTPTTADWTVDTSPPSVPANLSGSAVSPHDVDLSWSASSDNTGVTGYDILRNGSVIATVSGTTLTYADTTAAPSTSYQYAVDARDGAGNVSEPSSPVPVTTGAAPPGPVFVQGAGSSTTTVTLPAPSTAGDLLVLTAGLYTGASQQIKAVSDGKNTWTKVGSYSVSGRDSEGELWYTANAASVSSVTVTTAAAAALQLQEFSGVAASAALDTSAGTSNTGTSASSGTATATSSDDLAVGFIAGHKNTQTISVSSPGYTAPTQTVTTSPNPVTVVTGYQVVGTPGPQSFAGTFGTAMYWAAGVALFKPGAPAPPPPPSNDFSLATSPTNATVTAGSPATSTISTAVTSGVTQSVALSATGAPTGALVSFNPQTVNAGQSSTMTVTTSSTTPAGTSTITVTGTGSSATHSASFSLTVNPAPVAPTITSSTGATFTVGTPGTFTVTTGGVPTPSLSESGSLPTGVGFTDNGNGTATLSGTPATGTAASYPITIGADNGVGSPASQGFTLTVDPPVANDFSLAASPTSATVTAGSPATSTISTTVTSGATQPVALSATGAPTGALVSFNPQTVNAGQSSTMTVTTSSTTPTGTSTITVTGTGSSATHSASFSLT
ncbi:MAG: fibronectin type III domain-containing protein, partial [Acidimicrobiales bacterium]